MHREKRRADGLLRSSRLHPNAKLIPPPSRGHFVRSRVGDREAPRLSGTFRRRTEPELYFDVAPLSQSEPPQDWDVQSTRIWFKLQAMRLRDRVFYSSLLTCSIYISDNCMFYLKIFLLRAGLNSVGINCWVGTSLRPGPNLQFLNKCGHSSHTVDYIYLYIRLRACLLHMHILIHNYYAKCH